MRHSKKIAAIAIATAGALGLSGLAYAYWTSDGTGDGSATAGAAAAWLVTSKAATGGFLSPDGPTNIVGFDVKNEGSGVQKLQQVVVSVAEDDGNAWSEDTCDADDFKVGSAAPGDPFTITIDQELAANAIHNNSVTIQMVNNVGENQDDCKDVTVPLYFAAS